MLRQGGEIISGDRIDVNREISLLSIRADKTNDVRVSKSLEMLHFIKSISSFR
jgi:hypothetical protein